MTFFRRFAIGVLALLLSVVGLTYLRHLRMAAEDREEAASDQDYADAPQDTAAPPQPASVEFHPAQSATPGVVLASPGRVEGLSETTQVAAAANGILKAVYVQEGQLVRKGTLLGEIDCDDLKAGLQEAIADADAAQQAQLRVLRGSKKDEKRVAAEKTNAARAVFDQAKAERDRMQSLYDKQDVSRSAYEQAVRDFEVAQANLQAAVNSEQLVDAPALDEEKARAEDDAFAAGWRVKTAQEQLAKCSIIAPMDGTVLRVYAKPGESFSTVTPRPLFTLADASGRRVRAEVDEADIAKIAVGQDVVIEADALQGKKLYGTVVSISPMMGRKNIETGDPAAKSDRDVLEALISYADDAPRALPIGLRVTVQFLSGMSRESSTAHPQPDTQ